MKNKGEWYNKIHFIYNVLGDNYKLQRIKAIESLNIKKTDSILDLCCGNGRNIKFLKNYIGERGQIVGVDISSSLLSQAKKKYNQENIFFINCEAENLSNELIKKTIPKFKKFDKVICTLGLTVVPKWEDAFVNSFELLKIGGIYVIMDLYWQDKNCISKAIDLFASSDSSRKTWGLLEKNCQNFHQSIFPFWGGYIINSSGKK